MDEIKSGQLQGQEVSKFRGFLSAVLKEEKSSLDKKLKHIKKDFLVDVIAYLLGEMDSRTVSGLVGEAKEDQDVFEEDGEDFEEKTQKSQSSPFQSQSQNIGDTIEAKKDKTKICSFYLRGVCKHGKFGKECQFYHPKVCFKFKKEGRDGCQRGKNCKFAHVTFCKKVGCQGKECKFGYHLDKKNHNQNPRAYPGSSQFLLPRLEPKRDETVVQSQESSQHFLEGLQRILHQTIAETMRSFLGSQNQF